MLVRTAPVTLAVLLGASPLAAVPAGAAGIPTVVKQTGSCSALAPQDWSLTTNAQQSTAELVSGDGRMYAGWGVTQIDRFKQRYYGPLYGDPATSVLTLTSLLARAHFGDATPPRYTSGPQPFLGYFVLRRVASARMSGIVFYHVYPLNAAQYVESAYFALADAALPRESKAIPAGVAVSIRCTTQLQARRAETSSGSTNAAARKRAGCGGEGNLRGYNKELGTQWAHTASGTNYLFDIGDWMENGRDGPGYYAKVGNQVEKLELGRDDDC